MDEQFDEQFYDNPDTTIDEIFPLRWLKASLLNEAITLTISSVRIEYRDNLPRPVLSFAETQARLLVNHTNAESIAKMYGRRLQDWTSKRITLYKVIVPYGNDLVPAIRVREPESEDQ